MRALVLSFIFLFFLGSLGLAGGVSYWFLKIPPVPAGSTGDEAKVFDLSPGLSARAVAQRLKAENLIKHENLFLLYARVMDQLGQFKVGGVCSKALFFTERGFESHHFGPLTTEIFHYSRGMEYF